MTALLFICAIAALFALVLAWEAGRDGTTQALRPAGLLSWFIGGNWPAKAGALLLTIGTGALLRYLMLNIDFPASGKLMTGVLVATALGAGSAALKRQPKRRPIHLALGGAALGVAYLTAYSAYGFFKFVPDVQALGALFIVACGATVFALNSRALSIAVLAMVGAFMAPAFALEEPGPTAVYGYYLLASLLVLLMVWQRGWRPLIHLSFLFTLAGGLFLGWTNRFYTPAFHAQMQPLLLLIVAVHLLMPLAEPKSSRLEAPQSSWSRRFDLGYFLLLPLSALVLTLTIAPDVHHEGAADLLAMAGLWALATVAQQIRWQEGTARYGAVALALALLAGLLWWARCPTSWSARCWLARCWPWARAWACPNSWKTCWCPPPWRALLANCCRPCRLRWWAHHFSTRLSCATPFWRPHWASPAGACVTGPSPPAWPRCS